jgi:hypothetical protein
MRKGKDETGSDEVLNEAAARRDGLDSWIDAVAPDPDATPDVHVLWGFVGTSALDDHTRLYLDPRAQYAVDIHQKEIVHRAPLGNSFPLGGSILWITGHGWRTAKYRAPQGR